MRQVRFEIFSQTPQETRLRFFGTDGRFQADRRLSMEEVDRFIVELETGYQAVAPNLPRLGQRLYTWLDGPTERWLTATQKNASGLAVHIDVAGRLRHLPWELLSENGVFLCALPNAPLTPVRRVAAAGREISTANRPLRLLFMACSVEGQNPLEFEREEAMILEATRRQSVELDVEESGSLEGLRDRVESVGSGYFDIFHMTGHADVFNNEPCFLMENDRGGLQLATAEDISRSFAGNWPALVFLSGCKTGKAVDQGAFPSLCERLVLAGAPAVLGWALPVGDNSANRAAQELYHHLAAGRRIDEAVARTRAELQEANSPYWHLLRLYSSATPLVPLVTPRLTIGRAQVNVREAQQEFLDAGSRSEVCPRGRFVGRRRAIQRCLRILQSVEGEKTYHEGVLLCGIGGIGKSSLAARLCERISHRRIVMVGRMDEIRMLHIISERLEDPDAAAILNDTRRPLRQRFRLLLIGTTATRPILFVFDDFEENVEQQSNGAPRLNETGRAILKPEALEVLSNLMAAIRDTRSPSRVLVTCRYQFASPGPARFFVEELDSLRGSDLEKKISMLKALSPEAKTHPDLSRRALLFSGGNPRLLERFDELLSDEDSDYFEMMAKLETTTENFRGEILLRTLLASQPLKVQEFLARLAVFRIPVDQVAIEVVEGDPAMDICLQHAAAVGLVESTLISEEQRFHSIPDLLHPLLESRLVEPERKSLHSHAAQHLYRRRRDSENPVTQQWALEVRRLALIANDTGLVATATEALRRLDHLSKFHKILEMENLNAPPYLTIGIDVLTDDNLPAAMPSNLELQEGDGLILRISNRSTFRLDFVVFNLQPDYGVTQLLPPHGSLSILALNPGEEKIVRIKAWLPPNYDMGVDVLKVFAIREAASLHWLELPPIWKQNQRENEHREPKTSLEQFFAHLISDRLMTRSLPPTDFPDNQWISAQVEIRIRR